MNPDDTNKGERIARTIVVFAVFALSAAFAPFGAIMAHSGDGSSDTTPPTAPAQSDIAWQWPAEGTIVGSYVAGDATKRGLDISGAIGQPITAAADGIVAYSGSGLAGYGELIIIKHGDQWLSAYGQNHKRLVREGQRVRAGDQIAEMGDSVAHSHTVHFEIRYKGIPIDPLHYLPKR